MQLQGSTADSAGISELHSYGCVGCGLSMAAGSIKGPAHDSWASSYGPPLICPACLRGMLHDEDAVLG